MSYVGDSVTMAPEVANSQPYGLKADIYSLGVLTYFIVCGKYPFYEGYQKNPMNGNKLVEFPREVKLSQPFK
jgi:serine/threonine protein kinase